MKFCCRGLVGKISLPKVLRGELENRRTRKRKDTCWREELYMVGSLLYGFDKMDFLA